MADSMCNKRLGVLVVRSEDLKNMFTIINTPSDLMAKTSMCLMHRIRQSYLIVCFISLILMWGCCEV